MSIYAVVRSIQLAAHKPLPEGRITGIQRAVPVLVPAQHFGVLVEALGKLLLAEPVEDVGIGQIGLADELRRRIVIFLLAPMNCDLSFAGLDHLLLLTNISHISTLTRIEFVPP